MYFFLDLKVGVHMLILKYGLTYKLTKINFVNILVLALKLYTVVMIWEMTYTPVLEEVRDIVYLKFSGLRK